MVRLLYDLLAMIITRINSSILLLLYILFEIEHFLTTDLMV